MLTDILEQKARLMDGHWIWMRGDLEVHLNIDDYHRLFAELARTSIGYYLEYELDHNRIYGMEIVIDDSEKPCVKFAK